MKYVFAVKDEAVSAFGQPIFVRARGEALRAFQDECANKDSAIHKHPNDYSLWNIGTYDDNTGALTALEPQKIASARDYLE